MAKKKAKFRESQRQIIEEYNGGMMGISAVPGSGKTFTLSHLAARLVEKVIAEGADNQEVLIVTFSNSGVNSFKKRIADILEHERKLMPYIGYRVRTLHGLAHDIVRERPALVGLAEDFQIVDERTSAAILADVVNSHLPAWGRLIDRYISPDLAEGRAQQVRGHHFPQELVNVAARFIETAKNEEKLPQEIQALLENVGEDFDLARFSAGVYVDYQRTLAFRGAVDFNDLIVLALRALRLDPQYLVRLQAQFPYVLEDEAQDSSFLQEKILRLLAGGRNWVRVGDPNQAINTTFTDSDASFLRKFLEEPGVQKRELVTSGRSSQKIIDMANRLVHWTHDEHPVEALRNAFYVQDIIPTPPGDPQQNPSTESSVVYVHEPMGKVTPELELDVVVRSLARWLPENQDKTVALLVPENSRGFKLVELLRESGIAYEELLRSTTSARVAVSYMAVILAYLASPHEARLLAEVYRDVWLPVAGVSGEGFAAVYQFIRGVGQVEALVWGPDVVELGFPGDLVDEADDLRNFLAFMRYCLAALSLPVDQLVLTVSQQLFSSPVDIALGYKVSGLLRYAALQNPDWGLVDFVGELRLVVENQRRFIGFESVSDGFEPQVGLPTVATMHASKGLEWDRVYLLAVSNYAFPSVQAYDDYVSERWFVVGGLSLVDEVLAQLGGLLGSASYWEGQATHGARLAYSAERLRLLYVAMTRARSDLVVTWNVGRRYGGVDNVVAVPVMALM